MSSVAGERNLGSPLTRRLYFAAGLGFVGLGVLGAVLPVMPSTVFFIVALWAFKKSSARMENWLLNHRVFGPTLRDWDENRWLTVRTKVWAILAIWLCMALTIWWLRDMVTAMLLAVCGLSISLYMATRKTKPA